jgi:hypothetical protein
VQSGLQISKEFPYNKKSDNFIDLSPLSNMVVAALTDEEYFGDI